MQIYNLRQHRLWRINKDGFYEEIVYTGSLRNKPKGWKIRGIR